MTNYCKKRGKGFFLIASRVGEAFLFLEQLQDLFTKPKLHKIFQTISGQPPARGPTKSPVLWTFYPPGNFPFDIKVFKFHQD